MVKGFAQLPNFRRSTAALAVRGDTLIRGLPGAAASRPHRLEVPLDIRLAEGREYSIKHILLLLSPAGTPSGETLLGKRDQVRWRLGRLLGESGQCEQDETATSLREKSTRWMARLPGLLPDPPEAPAGQRLGAVQDDAEAFGRVEQVDRVTAEMVVPIGVPGIDAVRVMDAVVPMEAEPSWSGDQQEVVRVPGEVPTVVVTDPRLDEAQAGARGSTPAWVRDGQDDGLRVAALASKINLPESHEHALGGREPLVQLLCPQSPHAPSGAARCSPEMPSQSRSASSAGSSRRVTVPCSPSSSIRALRGTR